MQIRMLLQINLIENSPYPGFTARPLDTGLERKIVGPIKHLS